MQSDLRRNAIRFVLLLGLQVLVARQIAFDSSMLKYVHVLVYPLFLLLLPVRISHALLVGLGFLTGILLDMFYGTPGVHASAATFTAFIRPFVLNLLRPREGYAANDSPTPHHIDRSWFFVYSAIILLTHLFFYFSVVVFTYYYMGEILLRTISSFIVSYILIQLIVILFNPR